MTTTSSPFSLAGRVVTVVGASGGIGRACVETLRDCGARVLPSGRDRNKLESLATDGQPVSLVDFGNLEGIASWADSLPTLDGVVFATGVAPVKPFTMTDAGQWEGVMRVNVHGPMLAVRELLRVRKLGAGFSVVFVGSIAARRGAGGYVAYSASKGALTAGVRSLALELAPAGGRANVISPGLVQTRMAGDVRHQQTDAEAGKYAQRYPLGPGQPEDVAHAAAYLLSPAARWITGSDLLVDGGVTLA